MMAKYSWPTRALVHFLELSTTNNAKLPAPRPPAQRRVSSDASDKN
jgi:hypothetical protein